MSRPLEGKVVLITGAARGIGAAYAEALAEDGASLIICDLNRPVEMEDRLKQNDVSVLAGECDVADRASVEALVDEAVRQFGQIDVLINNAGIFTTLAFKPIEEIDTAEWDRVMAVNVRGTFEVSRAVLPVMRRRRSGKIINIASGTVFKGVPFMLHYVGSKGAVVAMTRAMARELGDDGITCNCLAPGLTMSEGVRGNGDWAGKAAENNINSRCLKREAVPTDLIGALRFLTGPGSDFMTGQTMVVDGGSVTH